jgi:hypothetical protein
MTIYGPNGGVVVGQPISPFFGAQNGASPAGGPIVQAPLGINVPVVEACARGQIPRNMLVTSVGGVSCGAQNGTPIDDLFGNGAGAQVNSGVAVAGVSNNPISITGAGLNNQTFVEGTSAGASLSTGPDPFSTETLTSCPVSHATLVSQLTLSGFQG